MQTPKLTAQERVDQGIEKFDSLVPGWEEKIDKPIDVAWSIYCPGGQVFGSYAKALDAIGLPDSDRVMDLGLNYDGSDVADLAALNAEWESRIALRREEQKRLVDELMAHADEQIREARVALGV